MQAIIVGTTNPAKKGMVQAALSPLGVTVRGADELGLALTIVEDGTTARDNARKKSLTYARAVGRPVLSIDNALYLAGLPDEEQPGVNTRRVPGVEGRASDEDLIRYYAQQIERLGGAADGHWEVALCIADEVGRVVERSLTSPRRFVSIPSAARLPGYPLESIQVDPRTGKYMADMTSQEQGAFWQAVVGEHLRSFIQDARGTIPGIVWDIS